MCIIQYIKINLSARMALELASSGALFAVAVWNLIPVVRFYHGTFLFLKHFLHLLKHVSSRIAVHPVSGGALHAVAVWNVGVRHYIFII